jgi:hypothetical protein
LSFNAEVINLFFFSNYVVAILTVLVSVGGLAGGPDEDGGLEQGQQQARHQEGQHRGVDYKSPGDKKKSLIAKTINLILKEEVTCRLHGKLPRRMKKTIIFDGSVIFLVSGSR